MFDAPTTNPELRVVTRYSVEEKLNYIRSHFDKVEKIFIEESKALSRQISAENERAKEHEDDSQYDYRPSETLLDIEYIYLRMHRYSSILAIYAYLENSMNKLCGEFESGMRIPISVTDLGGEGIVRCRNYLVKLAGIDFSEVNREWSNLKTLNKVRNCIMHADGDAEKVKNPQSIIREVENSRNLFFLEKKLLMAKSEYVYNAIDDTRNFLVFLADRLCRF